MGNRNCGLCGDAETDDTPIGQRQDGDILVRALWGGKRSYTGKGLPGGKIREYPRISNINTVWMAVEDYLADQQWFEVVEQPAEAPVSTPPPPPPQMVLKTAPKAPVYPAVQEKEQKEVKTNYEQFIPPAPSAQDIDEALAAMDAEFKQAQEIAPLVDPTDDELERALAGLDDLGSVIEPEATEKKDEPKETKPPRKPAKKKKE